MLRRFGFAGKASRRVFLSDMLLPPSLCNY
jgi:hypothetical protein